MASKGSSMDGILAALRWTSVELVLFLVVALFLFVVPLDFGGQGLQLLLYKVLLFSGSQLHAMVVRKWFFPYIDFSYDISAHKKYMVIAPHMGAAYVYSQGG
jgi:hypothetical protein